MVILPVLWYRALGVLGVTTLARRLRNAGVILCYHNVVPTASRDAGEPSLHIPMATFERQMRWLTANCELVSLSTFVDHLRDGTSGRHLGAVTFDDGYRGVFEHAWPVLRALDIPATVFVVAAAPGRSTGFWWDDPIVQRAATTHGRRQEWLTDLHGDGEAILSSLERGAPSAPLPASHLPAGWDMIRRAVASGMSLGVHSVTHRSLPRLDDPELRYEVITGRDMIAQETGVSPEFFAYPYGLWDQRVQRAVRAAGYRGAVTLNRGLNRVGADSWTLRRVNVPAGIHDSAFQAWASGLALRKDCP